MGNHRVLRFKKGTKVKFWMESCGRNHFGTVVESNPKETVVTCPELDHGIFDEPELMSVKTNSCSIYQESDKFEEARERLNYLLRTSSDVGIAPKFRKEIVSIIHLLGGQTDKEQGYEWGKD